MMAAHRDVLAWSEHLFEALESFFSAWYVAPVTKTVDAHPSRREAGA